MADSGASNSSLVSGWMSLLGNRLLLALLAVSLIPLALTGVAMYSSSAEAIKTQAFNQLETVRTITAKSVERYFERLHDQLRVAAEDRRPTPRDVRSESSASALVTAIHGEAR